MSTLINKCYLIKVSTKGGGGVKNAPNSVYVVCTQPHIEGHSNISSFTQSSINNFLGAYGHGKYPGGLKKCKWNESISNENWCHVSRRRLIDLTHNVPCSKNENWGYALAQPCILIKVWT